MNLKNYLKHQISKQICVCYKSSVGMLSCVSSVLPWHFFSPEIKKSKGHDITQEKSLL